MANTKMLIADMRWIEDGWREAFRARLCGWVPCDWQRRGIQKGVFVDCELGGEFELTTRAQELTDLSSEYALDDIRWVMGMTMVFKEFEIGWFAHQTGPDVAPLAAHLRFDAFTTAQFKEAFEAALEKERSTPEIH